MLVFELLFLVFKLLIKLLLLAFEAVFWIFYFLRQLFFKGYDATKAARSVQGGSLRCPRGHEVPTEGVAECTECGYTWEGSLWRCPNPECGAVTPFLDCPSCGLSVRSPYRIGRP